MDPETENRQDRLRYWRRNHIGAVDRAHLEAILASRLGSPPVWSLIPPSESADVLYKQIEHTYRQQEQSHSLSIVEHNRVEQSLNEIGRFLELSEESSSWLISFNRSDIVGICKLPRSALQLVLADVIEFDKNSILLTREDLKSGCLVDISEEFEEYTYTLEIWMH